jgi:Fe2+ transport system protein FeoA
LDAVDTSRPANQEDSGWDSLDRLEPGRCGTVREVQAGDDEIDRLKAMGVCEGRKVMVVRNGDPLILRVLGSRVGVSARLAARVRVETCTIEPCASGEP